ncbi:MAG: DNA double-strand break repair nuclease NurA [Abditibacteriales bacterium]|nr:DNA double-strand break repair nuclease NurA [Abditibacteriales bacterium]MDW8366000.1 DNA double-strand break repair nuclease NurA [Abditibacteriales bacterium]
MLDFAAVKRQINDMVREQRNRREELAQRVQRAWEQMMVWSGDWTPLIEKVRGSKTSWLLARITEPAHRIHPRPPRPPQLTVVATDGSQIFPDRHEVSDCYLLNIGAVALPYGSGARPLLSARPLLFFQDADLTVQWNGRRIPVTPEIIGLRRTLLEMEELVRLAQSNAPPRLALVDGTLILWTLEGRPADYKATMLKTYLEHLDTLREHRVPVAAYISAPGSTDVVNALRVGLCPYSFANCDFCEYKHKPDPLPCAPIEGVSDAMLFARLLSHVGERSAVFRSASSVLAEYGEHAVCFFYLHVGAEIARVEIPQWVAEDDALLDLVHSGVADQAEKGRGYPVALAEAHAQAVVRGAEREMFYRMMEDTFIRSDVPVRLSLKARTKRTPGV